ncbi:MAG: diacylglycerol kinase family lipid kinase [Clostridia bacterium]|nr:diacylglycerol kinase family lipid kinase [Clostridia bacterium]
MKKDKKKTKDRTKVLMIVNPRSGKLRPSFSARRIAEMFLNNNMEAGVYFTSPEYNADFLVREHEKDFDIIACCGGDGTLSETVSGMMEIKSKKPIGYIPAGTTNDLARSLRMATKPEKAAKVIITEKARPLDIGSFDDSYFVYIASFGAFTEVSYATSQKAKNIFGRFAYFFGAMKYMTKIQSHHINVEADGKTYEGDYAFGSVTNSTSVAGIFKFENDVVDFADGKYEVMLIKRPKNLFTAFAICMSMLNKTYKHKNIEFFHASDIRMTCDEPLDWAVDGEHKKGGKAVHIQNHPQAVNLIMKKNKKK